MKKSIFTATVFSILLSTNIFASEFCDGFKQGYQTGYAHETGYPNHYIPSCPYPPSKGYNDPKSDYEHGYVVGLRQGMQEGN